jgi:hypothetical protein
VYAAERLSFWQRPGCPEAADAVTQELLPVGSSIYEELGVEGL